MLLGAGLAAQAQVNNITFRVDMTEQLALGTWLPGDTDITVSGELNGWGSSAPLTNNPSLSGDLTNIYSGVLPVSGPPGGNAGGGYKFRMKGGWEDTSDGNNRNFTLIGGDQVLPIAFYNDQPVGVMTNANITFQIDMTPQVLTGGFTNGAANEIRLSGRINGWGAGELMTNNPAALGNASNLYSCTIPMTDTVGNWSRYKFRQDGGWESSQLSGVGNNKDRRFFVVGGDQVLPLATYSDASLCDLTLVPTTLTVVLHITNGTTALNGWVFTNGVTPVSINGQGLFGTWLPWSDPIFNPLPKMTNNPVGSDFYEFTTVIPAGRERGLAFKFGIGDTEADNEGATGADHLRYIRTSGSSYTMPMCEFGTNFAATRVESAFGNLKAGAPLGGTVPVTWEGLPCVTLQSRASLSSGTWTDHPATDGLQSTNWSNTGSQFFRLQKRRNP